MMSNRPEWLTANYCSDGQRYTELLRKTLMTYVSLYSGQLNGVSINGTSFIKDGGVDGVIDCPNFGDPFNYLSPKTVLQFKSGDVTDAQAKREILKPIKDKNREKANELIKSGHRVVWFVAATLQDTKRLLIEDGLKEAVRTIAPDAEPPIVIDNNRLSDLLSKMPAFLLDLHLSTVYANSIHVMLHNPPYSTVRFTKPSTFPDFVTDLKAFVSDNDQPLLTLQGTPGIGKTRRVLEALNSDPVLASQSIYVVQNKLDVVLGTLRERDVRGVVLVVDDYVDDPKATQLTSDKVPTGCKAILIRNSFDAVMRQDYDAYRTLPELSISELHQVLSFFEDRGVLPVMRQQAIDLSRNHLRLAIWICTIVQPGEDLTQSRFDDMVRGELRRTGSEGVRLIHRLSLLRYLPVERQEEFVNLVGFDIKELRNQAHQISQRSAFIQKNDGAMYVAIPLIAQMALIDFWESDPEEVKRILENAGFFADHFLTRVSALPQGKAKEEMMCFFDLPPMSPTLENFQRRDYGVHV